MDSIEGDPGAPTLSFDGARAIVRLNRPDHHNRLEPRDVVKLGAFFSELERREDVRVLLISGSGPTFCSGYHLGVLGTGSAAPIDPAGSPAAYGDLADRLASLPMPTIAVVNGSLYGGGVELAISCDFRIGVTNSKMFIPVALIGGQYLIGGMRRLVSRVGLAAAKRILLAGEHFDDAGMLRIGILDELVEPSRLWDTAMLWSDRIAEKAPLAVRAMKASLNEISAHEFDQDVAQARSARLQASEDYREGIEAIKAKRKPTFIGQ